jgi:hypothetical protein
MLRALGRRDDPHVDHRGEPTGALLCAPAEVEGHSPVPSMPAAAERPRVVRRLAAVAVAACAALALTAAPAGAARNLEVSLMDDQLLLGASQRSVDRNMAIIARLGVDRLRVSAFWNTIAPNAGSKTKPAGFDGSKPFDPSYNWTALDRVVSSAVRNNLKLMISITTPAPLWATGRQRGRNNLWRPSAGEFGAFAEAVATRYAPFVDHYGISNEPNQGGWLQPQSDSSGLVAPHLYRAMALAAYPRIKRGDPTSTALLANLAPSGSSRGRGRRTPIRPLAFLRAMACVNSSYRPTRRGPCASFRPIPLDAVGHHPYSFFMPPSRPQRVRDDIGIGDGRRLLRALDRLVARGALAPSSGRRLDVYYAEFGYQTNPPDPFAGISLAQQNRWLQDAFYVAWRTPRIRGLNQFRLTDGALSGTGFARFREFQSGLLFNSRRRKPAYRTFAHPFVMSGSLLWGQVRRGGRHTVSIQFRPAVGSSFGGAFRTIKRVRTDGRGYFRTRVRVRRGQYRYRYTSPSGTSGTITRR